MYTPVNPSFTIKKWGLRGSKLYRYVVVMYVSHCVSSYNMSLGTTIPKRLHVRPAKTQISQHILQCDQSPLCPPEGALNHWLLVECLAKI